MHRKLATRWPFPLPGRFLDQLGYGRAVELFESREMRVHLADLLRRQGLNADVPPPSGPRRYLMLYWEPAGDELAFSDGTRSGAGQLNHWAWLDYLHESAARNAPWIGGRIERWLREHQVDLGSSDGRPTHALVVDTESLEAYIARIALAHRVVRAQSLESES